MREYRESWSYSDIACSTLVKPYVIFFLKFSFLPEIDRQEIT